MAQFFDIHPENPQSRLITKAAEMIREGAVIVYPTDSAYAIACHLDDKEAAARIRRIRQVGEEHHMTLMCRDLSEVSTYAKLDENAVFRMIKAHTPGPYTFLLKASKDAPKRLCHPKRKTIGVRVPNNVIVQALLRELNEPLMSATLIVPPDSLPMTDPEEIRDRLEQQVDLIINGGFCDTEPTTVIDFFDNIPTLIRQGKGEW